MSEQPASPTSSTGDVTLAHVQAARYARLYPLSGPWQRALTWWQHVAMLAPTLPLHLVADLGMLLTDSAILDSELEQRRADPYATFLEAAALTPAISAAHALRLSDTLVVALLAHLARHAPIPQSYRLPTDRSAAEVAREIEQALTDHLPPHAAQPVLVDTVAPDLLAHLLQQLQSLTAADVQFLQLLTADSLHTTDLANLRALTDLLTLPALTHAILDELLTLIPALVEFSAPRGSQTYTIDGISGLARRGSLDAIIPTEWAFPVDLVAYRYLNNELLYYGHERPPERRDTLLLLLLQSGDAMTGDADVIGRALVLALSRMAIAQGTTVKFCWFDRHLHPPQDLLSPTDIASLLHATHNGRIDLPRVLLDVQTVIKAHAAQYARIEIQWLLHAQSGMDQVGIIRGLAQQLRNQAGCRALFLCSGKLPDQPPILANVLVGQWAVLPGAALHDAETRELAVRALRQLNRPASREKFVPDAAAQRSTRSTRQVSNASTDRVRQLIDSGDWHEALEVLEERLEAGTDVDDAKLLLIDLIHTSLVPVVLRVRAAIRLGTAGDPRLFDIAIGTAQVGSYWCSVSGGTFWYGDDRIGDPLQQVTLPHSYRIARFPVTNAEYAQFLMTGAHQRQAVSQPRYWHHPDYNHPNQPVVGISWREATAYCHWLTEQGHTRGWLPINEILRLPTSVEWERAARHNDWRRYPWGNAQPEGERANYRATGIGKPTPVGCFPGGAAECEAQDMVGNVMELMATNEATPLNLKPLVQTTLGSLVLGSYNDFGDAEHLLYCGSRIKYLPDYASNLCGFRVVSVTADIDRKGRRG